MAEHCFGCYAMVNSNRGQPCSAKDAVDATIQRVHRYAPTNLPTKTILPQSHATPFDQTLSACLSPMAGPHHSNPAYLKAEVAVKQSADPLMQSQYLEAPTY